jgi:hypothetical protein
LVSVGQLRVEINPEGLRICGENQSGLAGSGKFAASRACLSAHLSQKEVFDPAQKPL